MSNTLAVVVFALAAWRCVYMLAAERGPANVFARVRYAILNAWPQESDSKAAMFLTGDDQFRDPLTGAATGRVISWQFALVSCIGCLSVWVGLLFAALFHMRGVWLIGGLIDICMVGLALSSATIAIELARKRISNGVGHD